MLLFECLNIHLLSNPILAKTMQSLHITMFYQYIYTQETEFSVLFIKLSQSQSLSHPIYASNYLLALHLLDYKARSRVRHTERKSEFLLNSGPIRNVNNFEIRLIFPQLHTAKAPYVATR